MVGMARTTDEWRRLLTILDDQAEIFEDVMAGEIRRQLPELAAGDEVVSIALDEHQNYWANEYLEWDDFAHG